MPNNEFGDFQTPRPLAAKALQRLPGGAWTRVLEPTCGTGNFLHEARRRLPAAELRGIEAQPGYARQARATGAEIIQADIFAMDLGRDLSWRGGGPLLVVGNPPWVTNSQLGRLGSGNRPKRANVRHLPGIDAMTGASNFDIAEHVWLKLITELRDHRPVIALLCKTQVARNVLEYCARFALGVSGARMFLIDARRWFGVSVDACWFTLTVGAAATSYECELYDSLDCAAPARRFGVAGRGLIADTQAYRLGQLADGECPVEWRQGIKHDASQVMELRWLGGPAKRSGEAVDIESDYLYPLLKGTDLFHGRIAHSRYVIVPQTSLGQDTESLARSAPRLWAYLEANAAVLDNRKSSIYRSRPRFCVFGVGPYSFAPYKVGVSGLHKSAAFRLVPPLAGKPVLFDDTCYLLPFAEPISAAVVTALLESKPSRDLFRALAFWDAKRPITKRLLRRIDLLAVTELVAEPVIVNRAQELLAGISVAAAEAEIVTAWWGLRARWESARRPGPAAAAHRPP